MKKRLILILNISLLIFVISSFIHCAHASSGSVISAMNPLANNSGSDSGVDQQLGPIINTAIGFIQIIGTGISVIMVTILGIKYMLASPGEKADVKKQIAPLLIGAVLLFSAVNIIQIIAKFADSLPK